MKVFKRFLPQLIIVMVLCIISSVGIFTENAVNTNGMNILNRQTVIIDAGHGGLPNTIKV